MKTTKIILLVLLIASRAASGQKLDSVCFSIKEANRIDLRFNFYKNEIKSLETAIYENVAENTEITRLKKEWKNRALKCESLITSSNELLARYQSLATKKNNLIDLQQKQIKFLKRHKIITFIKGILIGSGVTFVIISVSK